MGDILSFPGVTPSKPTRAARMARREISKNSKAEAGSVGSVFHQALFASWQQVVMVGVTAEGGLEIINSEMSAERALWMAEWARRWALGLIGNDPAA